MDNIEESILAIAEKFMDVKSDFRKGMDRFYVLARAELILNLVAPNDLGPAHYVHLKAIGVARGLGLPDVMIDSMFESIRKMEE
jgi:hypothetical protein